ncbi:hypothetical protein LT493_02135 [Streptomyces tricolor]|nr:hypothetical protein [Streptomyces tricolor]
MLPAARAGEFVPPTVDEIEAREAARRTELRRAHDELVAELHRAQADGAVTDDQDLRLQELLADARDRLDGSDTVIWWTCGGRSTRCAATCPAFRQQATDRIRARLNALDPTEDERAQVLRHLDTGGLATAADLVYFLEIGEDVPEIDGGGVPPDRVLPGRARRPAQGHRPGPRRPRPVRRRSTRCHPVLDYSALSTDEAALAADALDEWRELAATEPKDRLTVSPRRQLPPLLKLLGYDAKSARPLDERSQHRREYRLFEATEVEINGRGEGARVRVPDRGTGRQPARADGLGPPPSQGRHELGGARHQQREPPRRLLRHPEPRGPRRTRRRLRPAATDAGRGRRGPRLPRGTGQPAGQYGHADPAAVLRRQSVHPGEARSDRRRDVLRAGRRTSQHPRPRGTQVIFGGRGLG